jgi:hypothetical protein
MEETKDNWNRIGGCENEEEGAGRVEERKHDGKEDFVHKLRLLWMKKSWLMQERQRSGRDRGYFVEGEGGHGSNVQSLDAKRI